MVQTPTNFTVLTSYAGVESALYDCDATDTVVFYFTEPVCPACDTIYPTLCGWVATYPTVKFYQIKTETAASTFECTMSWGMFN
ncbi:hypothetical protein DFA_11612 [Cavenderia fasciculata]|uniref:Thioredoxin domain-containing protein n=1 Tax=Cavenderia fasciculata TaxID=261658 RepID=F4QDQ4_CACFS|nr:uncharacterized protein DFA_11612 [Cavenderia fasciculata]EGG13851.1 hypothetical protein DFA_11612 [Cavenderia fasciculata]|eukprot:XP_004350559.1 hypothetical protein DFA_11612 [Cavenderia fasciculata]